ncbi:CAAX amino terminal protease self-immunity [Roseovarius gaetbuli]|uniref:CAAX amino terminal protease self-immunity n=1 Tax=Roseovarius gaetbuli TaxID=1356575 RepID=A0A1X6ZIJ8_9RHOB|nr:type II CAAX endopeptidase family protein [Roseovarius gaetbuli]SLN52372.1 CAAX amino terminal protease self-immunity [Roseovarius gaetbuli]
MRYDAHDSLVAPARATARLTYLIGGAVLGTLLFLVLSYSYAQILQLVFPSDVWARLSPSIENATSPVGVLVNLFIFAMLIIALAVALRVVHKRRFVTLVGALGPASRQFRRALVAMLVLYVVIMMLPLPEGMEPEPNLAFGTWLKFLPLALIGLFIQVFAEEVVFRGYLQSQLAARFSSPLIWIGVPSIGFALLHYDPATFGTNAWVVVLWAGAFGIAAGDLTARFGTLGPATALHFINNFGAILITAPQGQFDGLALYSYPFSVEDGAAFWAFMPIDMMILACGWLAIRLALRG